MSTAEIIIFAEFCIILFLSNILYTNYQTKKAVKQIQDLTDKTITEIRQECEGLLNDIAEKYLKEDQNE